VTPNRAFLRGFSATDFPDLGLRERWRTLVAIFGALSPHPKIPFPAAGLEAPCRRDFQASIERDTDPTRLSPDNVTMVIAVLCVDNQVE
jgi:hypothetical protein